MAKTACSLLLSPSGTWDLVGLAVFELARSRAPAVPPDPRSTPTHTVPPRTMPISANQCRTSPSGKEATRKQLQS
eukprot:821198-Rhodomonas_salina.1